MKGKEKRYVIKIDFEILERNLKWEAINMKERPFICFTHALSQTNSYLSIIIICFGEKYQMTKTKCQSFCDIMDELFSIISDGTSYSARIFKMQYLI